MPKGYTPRGFSDYGDLIDRYGNRVVVRESSLATEACVWIFVYPPEENEDASAHLTVEQAKQVRDALDEFIKDNEKEQHD